MKIKYFGVLLLVAFLMSACDMTTSNRVEGVWVSHANQLSVLYEETYVLNKGGAYTYERKQDGKSVYKEEGTFVAEMQVVGSVEDEQRVLSFTPTSPKDTKPYVKLYALENSGKMLVLGTYSLETDTVSKQRFYTKEVAK